MEVYLHPTVSGSSLLYSCTILGEHSRRVRCLSIWGVPRRVRKSVNGNVTYGSFSSCPTRAGQVGLAPAGHLDPSPSQTAALQVAASPCAYAPRKLFIYSRGNVCSTVARDLGTQRRFRLKHSRRKHQYGLGSRQAYTSSWVMKQSRAAPGGGSLSQVSFGTWSARCC